jgi:hypothetical protein
MTVRVTLPPGCSGINCADGSRYSAPRAGGSILVEDHHAAAIPGSSLGNMLSASGAISGIGTKKGRMCPSCNDNRVWNAWNKECPKCGASTVPAPR